MTAPGFALTGFLAPLHGPRTRLLLWGDERTRAIHTIHTRWRAPRAEVVDWLDGTEGEALGERVARRLAHREPFDRALAAELVRIETGMVVHRWYPGPWNAEVA